MHRTTHFTCRHKTDNTVSRSRLDGTGWLDGGTVGRWDGSNVVTILPREAEISPKCGQNRKIVKIFRPDPDLISGVWIQKIGRDFLGERQFREKNFA